MADGHQLDLTYITERIIALSFPAGCSEESYLHSLQEVTCMLKSKHGDNYLVSDQDHHGPLTAQDSWGLCTQPDWGLGRVAQGQRAALGHKVAPFQDLGTTEPCHAVPTLPRPVESITSVSYLGSLWVLCTPSSSLTLGATERVLSPSPPTPWTARGSPASCLAGPVAEGLCLSLSRLCDTHPAPQLQGGELHCGSQFPRIQSMSAGSKAEGKVLTLWRAGIWERIEDGGHSIISHEFIHS